MALSVADLPTFVELQTGNKLGFGGFIPFPRSIPDELSAGTVITVLQILTAQLMNE